MTNQGIVLAIFWFLMSIAFFAFGYDLGHAKGVTDGTCLATRIHADLEGGKRPDWCSERQWDAAERD